MTVKDLFDKAENGTLTYEQFEAALNTVNTGKDAIAKVRFADLSEGKYVSKQRFDDELGAKDGQITTLNDTIAKRDADLASLQEKLKTAGTDATKLSALTDEFTALKTKYETDTQAYKDQLSKQAYEFAVKEFAGGKKFTSNAAKRDFINSMIAKNLQVENGKILGAEDFVTAYSTDNADAFVVEKPNDTPPAPEDKPRFVNPINNNPNPQEKNPFNFTFAGVRPHTN